MKPSLCSVLFAISLGVLAACGPPVAGADDIGDDVDGGSCSAATELECDDTLDEDCDGYIDCADVDCFGVGTCSENPNCGQLDLIEGAPLALPDGNTGVAQTGCNPVSGVQTYTASINFTGFTAGQTLVEANDLLGVCVVVEHSWLRDLEIELSCPTGQTVVLHQFKGTGTIDEVFLGRPNDTDSAATPVPGIGWEYCWTPTATRLPMLDHVTANPSVSTMPSGDYQPVCTFDTLVGCTLNGDWTLRVADMWRMDNGFVFSWAVGFDPAIVEDCEDWPVP